ncbi:S8 family serine peptidase [Marinobacterium aestuariivivens]|uniref:S8 family serine peptidase n=1 Tax=Marinobacterium aestuariivivens TaxID=1698799 RepID=A0ABW2A5I5_9GAMM
MNNTGDPHAIPDPALGIVEVSGTEDADIDAPEAWDLTTGSSAVKIGILDTGVDCRGAGNPAGSLEFADGKCVEEVNFVSDEEPSLLDWIGHGTHVAGIAAATTDNGIGVAGVGWNSSIGSLKTCFQYYYCPYPELCEYYTVIIGVCPVSASANAIQYAADNGYHVINMSYASDEMVGGEPVSYGNYSQAEADAVSNAWNAGVVLVAAAGNEGTDTPLYPAAYPEVIAVGATDHDDNIPDFSSFGNSWVSLMAPGENIFSTVPNDFCIFYADILGLEFDPDSDACLDWYSGTSMASPHVAGAAALVWAYIYPGDLGDPGNCVDADGVTPCNQIVRQRLESGADAFGALGQNMQAWSQHGRLNLHGALTAAAEPPPPPPPPPPPEPELPSEPSGLSAGMVEDGGDQSAVLGWSHDGINVTGFDIERSTRHPKNGKITSVVEIQNIDTDLSLAYTDEVPSGTYLYRVRARNGAGVSAWSEASIEVVINDAGGGQGVVEKAAASLTSRMCRRQAQSSV